MEDHTIVIQMKMKGLTNIISDEGQNLFVCQMMEEGIYLLRTVVYLQMLHLIYHHKHWGLNSTPPQRINSDLQ